MEIEIFPQDLLSNVMDAISSREVSESSAPTSKPEPEDGEVDYASRAKEILDITFRRVRQRSTVQQAHLPPPADQTDEAENLVEEAADKPAEEDSSVPESSKASTDRKDQDSPYGGIIRHAGVSLKQDNADVFVVDLSFVPRKQEFKKGIFGKDTVKHKEIIKSICQHTEDYIQKSMTSDKFVVLIHSSEEDRTAMPSGKFARKFYKLLKARFSNELLNCSILKPSFKLKTTVFLRRPFLQKAMQKKIHLKSDALSFLEDQEEDISVPESSKTSTDRKDQESPYEGVIKHAEEDISVPESSKASIDRSEQDFPYGGVVRHDEEDISVPESSKASIDRSEQDSPYGGVVRHAEQDISVPESSKASIDRKDQDSPYGGVIRHAGVSLKQDNADVFVVDLSFVPRQQELEKGIFRKDTVKYKEIINSICQHTEDYIQKSMTSDKFVVLIHSSEEDRTAMPSGKFARKFYKLLKARFSNELLNCFILKPSFKLKTAVFLRRPFLQKAIQKKIHLKSDALSFLEDQGLPDSVLSIC
ncbi:uncharacterized protein LOC110055595 isoform X2 [Orbicella faveolata]|uniref:uncharacterized protein LOC110055595 isoform X2 n=1 Tax=Orbicella faveolata TaxID=48498 RepID=UPI0009E4B083|nr:uncharacterized protein LOC110055595 isoform X2 [Orbicella faveolata]